MEKEVYDIIKMHSKEELKDLASFLKFDPDFSTLVSLIETKIELMGDATL